MSRRPPVAGLPRGDLVCLDCDWRGEPDEILDSCPLCGSEDIAEDDS